MNKVAKCHCLVCGVGKILMQDWFSGLPRVTSDCKPYPAGGDLGICIDCYAIQKIPNVRFLSEIKDIYENYQAYEIAEGEEQLVFDSSTGALLRRSELIVRELGASGLIADTGKILDIGCGHGVTLRAFARQFPGWHLNGYEQSLKDLAKLKTLDKFDYLYTGDVTNITDKFQFITLIHTLEHLTTPVEFLSSVYNLLDDGGTLFIEVCNIHENPFDLLVADHLFHFSPETLSILLRRAGFEVMWMKTNLVKKELSALAVKKEIFRQDQNNNSLEIDNLLLLSNYCSVLNNLISRSTDACNTDKVCGVFGTSIAGSWLAGILGEKIKFFVDEDPGRVGKRYMNRLILAPHDIPKNSQVILALTPSIADRIAKKFINLDVHFIKPEQANP